MRGCGRVWPTDGGGWARLALGVFSVCAALAGASGECPCRADEPSADGEAFFERRIRPLLIERCGKCHHAEAKGGLRLNSRAGLLTGGDSGPAIVPGDPAASLLIEAVRYGDVVEMPPDGRLSEAEVTDLVAWVAAGAPWPAAEVPAAEASTASTPAPAGPDPAEWWALRPPVESPLPPVADVGWIQTPLDRFILARLEQAGLRPARPADKRVLIRRLTFDLWGLPPTPEAIDAYLSDAAPDATARLIERLLAAPAYGERWGRHWLDVARYADSNGFDENLAYGEAYRYRDWVVRAWNADWPYDRFLRAQIAGDLLPASGDEAADLERLVATGFLCLGGKMLAEDDPLKMELDIVDEQLDTLGHAVLGLTLGCARCHDHKFDPLSQADYYALAGIFKSTRTMENFQVVARWQERPLATPAQAEQLAGWEASRRAAQSRFNEVLADAAAAHRQQALAELAADLAAAAARWHHEGQLDSRLAEASTTPPPGSLVGEAEQFARGNVVVDFTAYGPEIGVIYNRGELPNWVEYDLDLPEAGLFQVELRYAAAEARPVALLLDGQLERGNVAERDTGSWHPDGQVWQAVARVRLTAGRHVLRLERAGPFPHFDKWALVPVNDDERDVSPWEIASDRELDSSGRYRRDRWLAALAAGQPELAAWPRWVEARCARSPSAAPASPAAAPSSPQATAATADSSAAAISDWVLREPWPETARELASRFAALTGAAVVADSAPDPREQAAREAWRKFLEGPASPLALPDPAEPALPPDAAAQVGAARQELAHVVAREPQLPQVMAVADGSPQNLRIHIRGSHWNLGAEVPRGLPAVFRDAAAPEFPPTASGRRELAEWLTRPDHPLTSRVFVNRVWRWHFGQGLVRSTDNFGMLGDHPSHPELLDWLATWFVRSGWSPKALHRLICNSATYQMASDDNPVARERDPDNRLCWRMNRRRLAAEELRDALLAVSGQLDERLGGTLLETKNREYVASTTSVNRTQYDSRRRSLYLPVVRSALYEVFQAFDFPEPSTLSGDRASTTVAPQALFILNSPLVHEASVALAARAASVAGADERARLTAAFRWTYGREPTADEVEEAAKFLDGYAADLPGNEAQRRQRAWPGLCRVILGASEFCYVD